MPMPIEVHTLRHSFEIAVHHIANYKAFSAASSSAAYFASASFLEASNAAFNLASSSSCCIKRID